MTEPPEPIFSQNRFLYQLDVSTSKRTKYLRLLTPGASKIRQNRGTHAAAPPGTGRLCLQTPGAYDGFSTHGKHAMNDIIVENSCAIQSYISIAIPVAVNRNGMHNRASVYRVILAPGIVRREDGTDQCNAMQDEKYRTNEHGNVKCSAQGSREIPVHNIVRHVEPLEDQNLILQYVYGAESATVKLLDHIPLHFFA